MSAEAEFLTPSNANLPLGLRKWQAERRAIVAEGEARHAEAALLWKKAQPERRRAAGNASGAKRRAAELLRAPVWADKHAIRQVYAEARRLTLLTGVVHHVDHDLPLQGKRVSGLHVANNLKVLPAIENARKSNKFEPE